MTKPPMGGSGPDNYGTPQDLFDWASREYGPFDLDVCAEEWNAKCKSYYSRQVDGLASPWSMKHGRLSCWMNPPYSRGQIDKWIDKAIRESLDGANVVALVRADTSTKWFHRASEYADIVFLSPRVSFIHPETRLPVKGNPMGSALLLFPATSHDQNASFRTWK